MKGFALKIESHFYGNPFIAFPRPTNHPFLRDYDNKVVVWATLEEAEAEVELRNSLQITLAHGEATMPDYHIVEFSGDGVSWQNRCC